LRYDDPILDDFLLQYYQVQRDYLIGHQNRMSAS